MPSIVLLTSCLMMCSDNDWCVLCNTVDMICVTHHMVNIMYTILCVIL